MGEISNTYGTRFIVKSQVTETLTGVTLKKTAERRKFDTRSVKMSFDGTSNKFKPGLPFSYVVRKNSDFMIQLQQLNFTKYSFSFH